MYEDILGAITLDRKQNQRGLPCGLPDLRKLFGRYGKIEHLLPCAIQNSRQLTVAAKTFDLMSDTFAPFSD